MIFETYQLDIKDIKNGKRSIKLLPVDKSKVAALNEDRRKIYIVCDSKTALYVGEANTSIKTRFQRSATAYNYFKANGTARGGYKGYKWLDPQNNKSNSLTLYVVIFDDNYDEKRGEIEAIEGELVYEIRQKTGKWTMWQNEIHFSNVEGANNIAQKILETFELL